MYVYILANLRSWKPPLYIGVTNDLQRRLIEHRLGLSDFTRRYMIDTLIYLEVLDGPRAAIARESQLKGWTRSRKLALIRTMNPQLRNLEANFEDAQRSLGSSPSAQNDGRF